MTSEPPTEQRVQTDETQGPIINNPWGEPARYHALDQDGEVQTEREVLAGRRPSGEEITAPRPKRSLRQNYNRKDDSLKGPHPRINQLRALLHEWRNTGRPGLSPASRRLMAHWTADNQDDNADKPYWCQLEAAENVVYLEEAINRQGGDEESTRLRDEIRSIAAAWNRNRRDPGTPGIPRYALKMATGTGKTTVMAMLIAWWTKLHQTTGGETLVITPNTIVRDRLEELKTVSGEGGSETWRRAQPGAGRPPANQPRCVINVQRLATSRNASLLKEDRSSHTKHDVLTIRQTEGDRAAQTEDPERTISRVTGIKLDARPLLILNDEGHHCYDRSLMKRKAETKDEDARAGQWYEAISILQGMKRAQGAEVLIVDLSATPFYLERPKTAPEGRESDTDGSVPLFPWTITNTPLLEAVEAGITKTPRMPVGTDLPGEYDEPAWRNLHDHVKERCGGGSGTGKLSIGTCEMSHLKPALDWLHNDFAAVRAQATKLEAAAGLQRRPKTRPVAIIVTDNIKNANKLYKELAGDPGDANRTPRASGYEEFSNIVPAIRRPEEGDTRPARTLIVHSKLDEANGDSETKKVLAAQKTVLGVPAVDPETGRKTSADSYKARLRELRDTAGQPGQAGADIRLIVSVQQLSEGWDCKGVTHVLGIRPFRSALLCEQVTGRALRRRHPPSSEQPPAERAYIAGIPFYGMPDAAGGEGGDEREAWEVVRMEDRAELDIEFPHVIGYRKTIGNGRLRLDEARCVNQGDRRSEVTVIEWAGLVPEGSPESTPVPRIGTPTKAAYLIARELTAPGTGGHRLTPPWREDGTSRTPAQNGGTGQTGDEAVTNHTVLFAQAVDAARRVFKHAGLTTPDGTAWQTGEGVELTGSQIGRLAARVYECIRINGGPVNAVILPVMQPRNEGPGASGAQGFETFLEPEHRYPKVGETTRKSVLDAAACHTKPEKEIARLLDGHPEIEAWTRNYKQPGWTIPWFDDNLQRWGLYIPDFIARLDAEKVGDDDDHSEPIHLIIEYKGQRTAESERKRATAQDWCLAVSNSRHPACRGFWFATEIADESGLLGNAIDAAITQARSAAQRHPAVERH